MDKFLGRLGLRRDIDKSSSNFAQVNTRGNNGNQNNGNQNNGNLNSGNLNNGKRKTKMFGKRTKALAVVATVLIIIVILYFITKVWDRYRHKRNNKHHKNDNRDSIESVSNKNTRDESKRDESKRDESKDHRFETRAPAQIVDQSNGQPTGNATQENTTEFFGKQYVTNFPTPQVSGHKKQEKKQEKKEETEKDGKKSEKDGKKSEKEKKEKREREDAVKELIIKSKDKEKEKEAKRPNAPVLRCYDFFEFPGDGAFHVKTCGTQAKSSTITTANPGTFTPIKIFVQWFPVKNAKQYNIYCNSGMEVDSTSNFTKKWSIGGGSHYYETEAMVSDPKNKGGCFSVVVTAVNNKGIESLPSKIFSTC